MRMLIGFPQWTHCRVSPVWPGEGLIQATLPLYIFSVGSAGTAVKMKRTESKQEGASLLDTRDYRKRKSNQKGACVPVGPHP
jgi:hypothetical protein